LPHPPAKPQVRVVCRAPGGLRMPCRRPACPPYALRMKSQVTAGFPAFLLVSEVPQTESGASADSPPFPALTRTTRVRLKRDTRPDGADDAVGRSAKAKDALRRCTARDRRTGCVRETLDARVPVGLPIPGADCRALHATPSSRGCWRADEQLRRNLGAGVVRSGEPRDARLLRHERGQPVGASSRCPRARATRRALTMEAEGTARAPRRAPR